MFLVIRNAQSSVPYKHNKALTGCVLWRDLVTLAAVFSPFLQAQPGQILWSASGGPLSRRWGRLDEAFRSEDILLIDREGSKQSRGGDREHRYDEPHLSNRFLSTVGIVAGAVGVFGRECRGAADCQSCIPRYRPLGAGF